MTTSPLASAPPSPWRWVARGAILGPFIGVAAALITGYVFAGTLSSSDVGYDSPRDFYVRFVRVGFFLGLVDGVVFGLIMRRLVGSEDRTGKTTKLAVLVPLPLNLLIFLSGPSLWTLFALFMLPPVLTITVLRIVFAIDRRTGRSGI
ncbi:MAG: hypothetical protein WA880_15470 [Ornithinimicrobium sp.]